MTQRIAFLTAATLAVALFVTSAQAQNAVRTFVSAATGSDGNPCSRTAPCRSFQHAHDVTNPGGEIDTLDPGGYGTVLITKAISIISGLGEAGVLVPSGGTGISINAGPSDVINLRGLVIEGAGVGVSGVAFLAGGFLTVQGCVIRNLTGSGIAFAPNVTGTSTSTLDVANTVVANNGGHGIYVQSTGSGFAMATFTGVQAINNSDDGIGVYGNLSTLSASPGIQAVVADSTIAGNGVGLHAFSASGHPGVGVTVSHTVVGSGNLVGLKAETNALLLIGRSTIAGNNFGWDTNGGTVQSYGDNYFAGNVANDHGPTPSISPN